MGFGGGSSGLSAPIQEGVEQSTTPVADTTSTMPNGILVFAPPVTIGVAGELYVATHIEIENDAVVNGSFNAGLCDGAHAAAGTNDVLIHAQTGVTAQAGAGAVQKVALIKPLYFRGGSSFAVFLQSNSATGQYRNGISGANLGNFLTFAFPTKFIAERISGTFTNSTVHLSARIYYRQLT